MSSPLSNNEKNFLQKTLITLHQQLSHHTRISILADYFAGIMDKLYPDTAALRCIDVGCGDMKLAEKVHTLLSLKRASHWDCLDIYPLPEELEAAECWQKYTCFDGKNLPFSAKYAQVTILCDVLHHTDKDTQVFLLRECGRVSEFVVVKEHYQFGAWSNFVLGMMDRFGNSAYGVKVPAKYFSKDSFQALYEAAGLERVSEISAIPLYNHLPLLRYVLASKWQFIAVLKSKDGK